MFEQAGPAHDTIFADDLRALGVRITALSKLASDDLDAAVNHDDLSGELEKNA